MNPFIKIHRSAHTIGGNCIEISTGEHRIILDCGLPLMAAGGGELQPSDQAHNDQLRPLVAGLFKGETPDIDAVLLSHAHPDHYGLLSHIHEDIPVFMSAETQTLLTLSDAFWPDDIRPKMAEANIQTYRHGDAFNIGPFTIQPYMMDHSAFGASAYCISVGGKRIIYTGDYRAHGRKSKCFDYLLKNVAPDIDCLLVEGTTLGGKHHVGFSSEADVEGALYECFKEQEDASFVIASGSNIDRTVSLYNAAKRAGKLLVIDLYQAYMLEQLKQHAPGLPPHADDHLRIHYIKGHANVFEQKLGLDFLYRMNSRRVSQEYIVENRKNMVLRLPTRRLLSLARRMDAQGDLTEAQCIYSMWQGYQEKDDRLSELHRRYGMPFKNIHVSGHAYEKDLQRLVETLRPQKIIPIHTLNREHFVTNYPQTQLVDDGEVLRLTPISPSIAKDLRRSDLLDVEMVVAMEGGAVYQAQTSQGIPCLLIDESAVLSMLSIEDAEGLDPERIYLFHTDSDRKAYINRRWGQMIDTLNKEEKACG